MDYAHQPKEPAGPGNAILSICPTEVSVDTAPPLSHNQPFQKKSHLISDSSDAPSDSAFIASSSSSDSTHQIELTVPADSIAKQESYALRTSCSRKLVMYYQNVRGLRTKIEDFFPSSH